MQETPTPTICRICKENCGILVRRSGGNLEITGNPDHPLSAGFICFKGRKFSDIHHSPERLRAPQLRKNGHWEAISYEDALEVLTERLDLCRRLHGAESVAVLKGESLKHQEVRGYLKHLTHAFGSPNYMSVGSICHQSLAMGHGLTYGGIPKADFQRIGVAVLWGSNIAASSVRLFARMKKAVKKGIKLLVVDPCETGTAKLADMHLKITPGTDGLLALAFLKSAVEDHGLSAESRREKGWAQLKELVCGASYADLLKDTGIREDDFFRASEMMFSHLPGWNLVGVGIELQPFGVQAIRAIACLQSIVDPETDPKPLWASLKLLPGENNYANMPAPVGSREAPLFSGRRGEGQAMFLRNAIDGNDPYPVRAMVIAGANPVLTFPHAPTQRKLLRKLDFLAVADLFMTATAREADLVLPAADHLDSLELHDYGQAGKPYLGLIRPIEGDGPGWPIWKWTFELARRLGLKAYFPWRDNEEAIAYRLAGSGIDVSQLRSSPASVMPYEPPPPPAEETKNAIHYYSDAAADAANAGMPTPASFSLPFSTSPNFPFWLSTGDRIKPYQHSQFRVSPTYRSKAPDPMVEIHPEAANLLGIRSEEEVTVATKYGQVTVRAQVTDQVRKDCIRITHGWDEANANDLTGLEYFDPLSGFPWCRALPATISKKED